MKRRINIHMKATATLALAALVFSVATVQARPIRSGDSKAATTPALVQCTIVISGAPWRIRVGVPSGSLSGDKYTLKARDVSCSSVRSLVSSFTKQKDTGQIKGPHGYKCISFSTAASADTLLYSGACMQPPHNVPFFEWGPKVPGH
jgi:hypothetical protein